ncbi:hypothetical protein GCM10007291_07120 [Gemmobacter nanjingensis]|uniref:FAD dependent oxidoreductase n=1 Tax=Gemmobacter nanjingensis TaxID=488454 RepID=A0ABQ3F7Z3_9RHOB|nr:FAD-dependent oxidoreductase [Gemmobacter nanjingensis]GHC12468.1 hypothetical protein GCM10007291_07120 [Gemmobacter nanjingensis]
MTYTLPITGSGPSQAASVEDHEDAINGETTALANAISTEAGARAAADTALLDLASAGDQVRLAYVSGDGQDAVYGVVAAQAALTLSAGQLIQFAWPGANTGVGPSLTIDSTVYTLRASDGTNLAAGDLRATSYVARIHSGTVIRLLSLTRIADVPGLTEALDAAEAADSLGDTIRMTNVAGTGDAVTADVPTEQGHISMIVGQYIDLLWPANNTAPDPTATIGGVTYIVRRRDGSALDAGDLRTGAVYRMRVQATGASPRLRVQNAISASDINGLGALAAKTTVGSADIDAGVVTNGKLSDMAEARIKGRKAGAGTGAPQDMTAAEARTVLGLGTAATTAASAYATAAQGATADSAVQPGDAVSDLAETATAKIMTGDERAKLAGIAPAATANDTDADLRDRTTHTGSQAISTVTGLQAALDGKATTVHTHTASQISDSTAAGRTLLTATDAAAQRTALGLGTAATTAASAYATAAQGDLADSAVQPGDAVSVLAETADAKIMTGVERTKLAGVAPAATANATDAALRDRATHTGSQAISTVTGLQAALDGKATAAQGAKADSAVQPGAMTAAISAEADARDKADVVEAYRPGENIDLWSQTTTGAPEDRAPVAVGTVTANADGAVLRITGTDIDGGLGYGDFAPRAAHAMEPNRVYLVRAVVRRVVNPADPLGHGVELLGRNLSAAKSAVSYVAIAPAIALAVADGRVEISAYVCRGTPPAGVTAYAPPATSRYMTPAIRIHGNGATTDIEALSWEDVTDIVTSNADIAAVDADLAAHAARADNPHAVTAAQVGLGLVDNTSDLAKPISTATQAALDGKATAAQGALADTAVQPGDAVSVLAETADAKIMTGVERSNLSHIDAQSDVWVEGIGIVDRAEIDLDSRATFAATVTSAHATSQTTGGLEPVLTSGEIETDTTAWIEGAGIASVAQIDADGRAVAAIVSDAVVSGADHRDVWIEREGAVDAISLDADGRVIVAARDGRGLTASDDNLMVDDGRADQSFDLVVYGGTLSGIMAAVRAKRRGLRVAIVDPWPRLGGAILCGGLVVTDFPGTQANWGIVQGLTRQFFGQLQAWYDDPVAARSYLHSATQMMQIYDPRAYQAAIKLWTREIDLIVQSSPIFEEGDLRKSASGAITAIRSAVGWLRCKVCIDASYEGDLIRASGAPYRIGREGQGETGEPFAGFKPIGHGAISRSGFTTPADGALVEASSSVAGLSAGDADDRVQTLSVRSILTQHASRVPFAKPAGYNKADYLIAGEGAALAGYTKLMTNSFADPAAALAYQGTVILRDGVSARQTNNGTGAIVSNEIGDAGSRYASGNWATRRAIVDAQHRWQQGLYYYLANDIVSDFDTPSTQALMADAQTWGMAPSLYPASDHGAEWPEWVYVREALRLDAAYVMTQADLYDNASSSIPAGWETWHSGAGRTSTKSSQVSRWSYFLDAHATRIYEDAATPGRFVFEGPTPPDHDVDVYDIPYTSLRTDHTAAGHVPNLLASVCIGCTHVAWMSLRMEPSEAMVGEAAGEAAALMVEGNLKSTHQVNIATLQSRIGNAASI